MAILQPICCGCDASVSTAAARYNHFAGSNTAWSNTETWQEFLVAKAGKIQSLRVKLTLAPANNGSYTFMLRKNGADTTLT